MVSRQCLRTADAGGASIPRGILKNPHAVRLFGCGFLLVIGCLGLNVCACAAELERGVGNYPKSINGPGFRDAFQKAADGGQVIMHHVQLHWASLTGTSYESVFGEYVWMRHLLDHVNQNLSLMLLLDVTPSSDRRQIINRPAGFPAADFSEPALRAGYVDEVIWLADHFKPKYFALGVEMEGYYVGHPEDYDSFVSLYKEAYRAVKARHPEMTVFVYFQYEGIQGLWKSFSDRTDLPLDNLWFLMDRFRPELDAAAFSSYPEAVFSRPEDLPEDYYRKIAGHTDLPVIFAELGWSSKYGPQGGKTSSPEAQAQFIRTFAERIRGLDVKLVTWYFLHDMDDESAFRGLPKWWATMGLRDGRGKPKPAWGAWTDPDLWRPSPLVPSEIQRASSVPVAHASAPMGLSDRGPFLGSDRPAAGPASNSRASLRLAGDLDYDGDVDKVDLALFTRCSKESKQGLLTGSCVDADFDFDGDVDFGDFLKFGDYMKKAKKARTT